MTHASATHPLHPLILHHRFSAYMEEALVPGPLSWPVVAHPHLDGSDRSSSFA